MRVFMLSHRCLRRILAVPPLILLPILLLIGLLIPGSAAAQDGPSVATHTVQPGETLYGIGVRYGVGVPALMAANGLADPALITVGQVLVIPAEAGVTDAAAGALAAPPTWPDPEHFPIDLGLGPVLQQPGQTAPGAASAADEVPPPPQDLGILTAEAARWLNLGVIDPGGSGLRQIYLRGLALGNNPHAFSKIGDCNSEPPYFLVRFDRGDYDLGPFSSLQPVIDHFKGSFARQSATVWTGNHAWALFDPIWANPALCQAGETPLECEFRTQRPSFVLIRLGTNEVGQEALFAEYLRKLIVFSLERGTIPVLGTKADRLEGSDAINETIRALAAQYGVPLWDFSKAADLLPARGLVADGFHMTYFPPLYSEPAALQTGHSVQNLTALMALDAAWRAVNVTE